MRGGEIIREARLRAGLSQQELAERLGTTQSVIARWETGARSPTFESLRRAVRAAGLDLHVTLGAPDRDHERFIRENLMLSADERLDRLTAQWSGLKELVDAAGGPAADERKTTGKDRAGSAGATRRKASPRRTKRNSAT